MREINYGISILRIIFTFQVVMGHAVGRDGGGGGYFLFIGVAVPFFMLVSFYLTYNTFVNQDMLCVKRRIFRICEPYVVYGIISFLTMSILSIFAKSKIQVDIYDLLWQLLLGTSPHLDPSLWFLFDMIVCSFIMLGIFKYIRGSWKFFLVLALLFASYLLQYTGANYALFSNFRYEAKWPLGRIAEMLPYACAGILCAHTKILEKTRGNTLFIFLIIILYLFFTNLRIVNLCQGFVYQGIPCLIKTILMFSLFHSILFENLSSKAKKAINFLSKYSLGIFCIHFIVISVFKLLGIDIGAFFYNFIVLKGIFVYAISFVVSLLIDLIPSKWAQNLVK